MFAFTLNTPGGMHGYSGIVSFPCGGSGTSLSTTQLVYCTMATVNYPALKSEVGTNLRQFTTSECFEDFETAAQ